MRYILILLGVFGTLGGIHGAVNITGLVTNFTNIGLTDVALNILGFVSATSSAQRQVATALNNWNNTLNNSITALGTTFQNYSAGGFIDTSSLAAAISSLSSVSIPTIMYDPSLYGMYSIIFDQASQTAASLIAFAGNATANASACATDFSSQCMAKYAANLTAASVNISRFSVCMANETSRVAIIGLNVSTSINVSLATSLSMLNLTNICIVPSLAQLNAAQSAGTQPPAMNCIQQFFSTFSSYVPTTLNFPVMTIPAQAAAIAQRMQRCITLTASDIQDILGSIANAYSACLLTGP